MYYIVCVCISMQFGVVCTLSYVFLSWAQSNVIPITFIKNDCQSKASVYIYLI